MKKSKSDSIFFRFNFPEIHTKNTAKKQVHKVMQEAGECYDESKGEISDKEAIDVYQAAETLLRVHFKGRKKALLRAIDEVIEKNRKRGYYKKDFNDMDHWRKRPKYIAP